MQALLTLNSCPMFTYNERDLHRMPTPARSHLPMKDFIRDSGILDEEGNAAHNNDADVALLRLPAPSLRGTFAKAYGLLAKLVSQIGWDELLKCRSQVFVMEEEYRMQKAAPDDAPAAAAPNGRNGNGHPESEDEDKEGFGPLAIEDEADDDASTKGVRDTPAPGTPTITVAAPEDEGADAPGSPAIPTIKVSTESDGERERQDIAEYESGGIEKPKTAVQGEPEGEEQSATVPSATPDAAPAAAPGSFNNKRLCERWLDNLFMVLYEVCPWSDCAEVEHPADGLSRTSECTPSGAPRSRTSRRSISPTARRAPSGRFSASSPSGCTTRRRPRTRSSARSTQSSPPKPGSSSSSFTPTRATYSAASTPPSASRRTSIGGTWRVLCVHCSTPRARADQMVA